MATFYERIRNVFTNELDQASQPSEISGTEQVAGTNYLFQEYERGKLEGLAEGQQQGRDELAIAIKNRMEEAAEEIGDYWIGELLQNGVDQGDVQHYFRGQIDAHNTQVGHLEELRSHGRITIDPPRREDFANYREQVTNYAERQREEYGFDSSEDGEDQSVSRLISVTPEMTVLADRIQDRIRELSAQLEGTDEDSYDTRTTIRREMGYLGITARSLSAGRQDIDLTIDIDIEQDEYGIREEEDSYTAIISRISPLLQEARALGFNTDVSLYGGEPEHEEFGTSSSQELPATPENNYGYLDARIQQVVAASQASRAAEITQSFAISSSQPTPFVSPTRAQQFARETPKVERDFGVSL